MMREETDEEIVREAIGFAEDEGYTELYEDASAALDRLVAERDRALEMMRSVPEWSRAEAAEKERDEALRRMDAAELEADNQGEMEEKAEARCATLEKERDAAVGRANAAEYARRKDNEYLVARAEAAEKERDALTRVATEYQTALANEQARCATLEAALRAARHELDQWVLADNREMAYRVERAEAIIDAALAAATPPAEET